MFGHSGYIMRRFGNRGLVLILFGFIWIVLGWGALAEPNPRIPQEPVPFTVLAVAFVVAGSTGMLSGLIRRMDTTAWPVMMLPPAGTAGLFTWWEITGAFHGAMRGVTVYAALSLALYFCARGLDRCPDIARMIAEERELR